MQLEEREGDPCHLDYKQKGGRCKYKARTWREVAGTPGRIPPVAAGSEGSERGAMPHEGFFLKLLFKNEETEAQGEEVTFPITKKESVARRRPKISLGPKVLAIVFYSLHKLTQLTVPSQCTILSIVL